MPAARQLASMNDMLVHARRIAERISSTTREAFAANETLTASVSMRLVWLAAAAERVPTAVEQYPDIPWQAIAQARDRVLHDYREVTPDEVWNRACTLAPKVIEALTSR